MQTRSPNHRARILVPVGYVLLVLCFLALITSIVAGSTIRTIIAVGCVYLTLTSLDYNRQALTRNVNQHIVNEASAADESGEGD